MRITTREQAIEDLSMFGIKEPYTYLIDIIPLVEMIRQTARRMKANSPYLTVQYRWLHFSNAHIRNPNHGTNTQMFHVGVSWFFEELNGSGTRG